MRIPSNRYVSSNIYREIQASYDKIVTVLIQLPFTVDTKQSPKEIREHFLARISPVEERQYYCAVHTFTALVACAGTATTEAERYIEALTCLMCGKDGIVSERKFLHKFERLYHIAVPYEQIY